MATYRKDPDAVLDYGCNWAEWLDGDTITASTWTATPSGLDLSQSTHDTTTTTVWVDGGTAGTTYELTNHITTAAGREDDRTLRIQCRDR